MVFVVSQFCASAFVNRIQVAKKEYNSKEAYCLSTLEEGEYHVWTLHTSCRY